MTLALRGQRRFPFYNRCAHTIPDGVLVAFITFNNQSRKPL